MISSFPSPSATAIFSSNYMHRQPLAMKAAYHFEKYRIEKMHATDAWKDRRAALFYKAAFNTFARPVLFLCTLLGNVEGVIVKIFTEIITLQAAFCASIAGYRVEKFDLFAARCTSYYKNCFFLSSQLISKLNRKIFVNDLPALDKQYGELYLKSAFTGQFFGAKAPLYLTLKAKSRAEKRRIKTFWAATKGINGIVQYLCSQNSAIKDSLARCMAVFSLNDVASGLFDTLSRRDKSFLAALRKKSLCGPVAEKLTPLVETIVEKIKINFSPERELVNIPINRNIPIDRRFPNMLPFIESPPAASPPSEWRTFITSENKPELTYASQLAGMLRIVYKELFGENPLEKKPYLHLLVNEEAELLKKYDENKPEEAEKIEEKIRQLQPKQDVDSWLRAYRNKDAAGKKALSNQYLSKWGREEFASCVNSYQGILYLVQLKELSSNIICPKFKDPQANPQGVTRQKKIVQARNLLKEIEAKSRATRHHLIPFLISKLILSEGERISNEQIDDATHEQINALYKLISTLAWEAEGLMKFTFNRGNSHSRQGTIRESINMLNEEWKTIKQINS